MRMKIAVGFVHTLIIMEISTYPTRHHHPFHFEIPFARIDHYKFSYYPKSIRDWNNLPTDTIESQSLQVFLDKL